MAARRMGDLDPARRWSYFEGESWIWYNEINTAL
jgi:hypothetical protein